MAEDDSTGGEVGRVIDVTRPEMLLVETGLLGETLRALTKTDDHYGLALNAWRYQDTWSDQQHADFWAGMHRLWPRPSGPQRVQDELAVVAGILRSCGMSEESIAELLRYPYETLRR
jgi:hypothetical protein